MERWISSSTAFRSSASLGTALERLVRYGRVLSDRVAARTDAHGEGLLLGFRDAGTSALHPGRSEFALAAALKLARDGTGHDITPLGVSFAHAAPPDEDEYRRYFRVPVRFSAGSTVMILSAVDTARPMLGADEALSSIVRRRLDKALAERDRHDEGPFSARVRRLMLEHLGATTLTPQSVARALAVSNRDVESPTGRRGRIVPRPFERCAPGVRMRPAAGSHPERRRRLVLPGVLGTRCIPSGVPALDGSDTAGVQGSQHRRRGSRRTRSRVDAATRRGAAPRTGRGTVSQRALLTDCPVRGNRKCKARLIAVAWSRCVLNQPDVVDEHIASHGASRVFIARVLIVHSQ